MSACILCQVRRAERPLRVEVMDIGLTSIEELCYFLDQNVSILDEHFFGDALMQWIRDELGLPELADQLSEVVKQDYELTDVLFPIMDQIHYLRGDERQALAQRIEELSQQPVSLRQKRQGDVMMKQGRYLRAIELYQKVLDGTGERDRKEELCQTALGNMGVAYAKLFQMEEAISCLREAYEHLRTPEAEKNYLFGVHMQGGKQAYERVAEELAVPAERKEQYDTELAGFRPKERPKDLQRTLQEWIGAYHRTVGA